MQEMKVKVPVSLDGGLPKVGKIIRAVGGRGVKEGEEVVLRYKGKVEIGVVVRTKSYSRSGVRFGDTTVLLRSSDAQKGSPATWKGAIRGPISKVVAGSAAFAGSTGRGRAEIKALSTSLY